jgi:hypothetical protein
MPTVPITYCEDAYEAARDCDAVVVVTEWKAFRELNLSQLKAAMRAPVLIDGRNLYDPAEMTRLGFRYRGIGRPNGRNGNGTNGHANGNGNGNGNGQRAASAPAAGASVTASARKAPKSPRGKA